MKFFLVSALSLVFFMSVMAVNKDEAKEMFRGMSQECKNTENATDADVELMIDEKFPDSKEGKCLVACMQESFGIVKDGKLQKEAFVGLASMAIGDNEAKMKQVDEIAEECKDMTHDDRCERAIMIGKCLADGAQKRNMTMD